MIMNLNELRTRCSCGQEHKIVVDYILIEAGATRKLVHELLEGNLSQYLQPIIICDENTYAAMEGRLDELKLKCNLLMLSSNGEHGEGLHADNHGVKLVQEQWLTGTDLIIAAGAGTIHDISRYVAHDKNIPFISVPTAASVDGFVSTVAAMTWDGMKTTLPAVSPIAVYADTDVFAKAPYRLTASGVSDLLGKYTALADWEIAHVVTGEHFCKRIYDLEIKALLEVESCIEDLRLGGLEASEKLMYALLLSGLAMQMMGNSRPASGAEHHVSHLWEMEVINPKIDALHGEKVSVGLLMVLEEYKNIQKAINAKQIKTIADPGMTEEIREFFLKKGIYKSVLKENTPEPLDTISAELLLCKMPEIAAVLERLPESSYMEELMIKAGCVHSMKEVGILDKLKRLTLQMSPFVRNRLTLMRLSRMIVITKD